MIYLVLSERTLVRLLLLLAFRRPVTVLAIEGSLPALQRLMEQWVARLQQSGRVRDLVKDRPDLAPVNGYNVSIDLRRVTNVFMEHETAMSCHFGLEDADRRFGRYGLAFRHIACCAMLRRYNLLYTVRNIAIVERQGVVGLDSEHAGLYRAIFDSDPPDIGARAWSHPLLNLVVAFGAFLAASYFVLARLRLRPGQPVPVFLASDFVDDWRDEILWREVTDRHEDVLVVCRNAQMEIDCAQHFPGWKHTCWNDGVFRVSEGMRTLRNAVTDCLRIYRQGSRLSPSTFYCLISMVYARVRVRGFLGRHAPRHFWARDDYNSDHIVRTDEFRRAGIQSLSIMHGVPTLYPVIEQLRYIDYDVYYVFGRDQYERYYKEKWPSTIRVRAVGCFALTRKELRSLPIPGQLDIACFLEPSFFEDAVFKALQEIADAFPDRTVHINVKENRRQGQFGERIKRLASMAPNVVEHRSRSYDLFWRCGYVIVDGSTLGLEAAQLGLAAFHLDLDPRWKSLYYRDFPALCVTSAEELIERIHRIEGGQPYPRHELDAAVEISEKIVWDVIATDMGLRGGLKVDQKSVA